MHPSSGTAEVLGERLGAVDVFELRPRIGLTSAALAGRVARQRDVLDVVVSAGYAVVGRWREEIRRARPGPARQLLSSSACAAGRPPVRHAVEGERKRVQIARALMTDPELLLLDEPAAGLDLAGREQLVARLATLAADPDAPTMVLVTHHVEEIPPGVTHGLLLRGGTVVAAGLIDDVLTAGPAQRDVRDAAGARPERRAVRSASSAVVAATTTQAAYRTWSAVVTSRSSGSSSAAGQCSTRSSGASTQVVSDHGAGDEQRGVVADAGHGERGRGDQPRRGGPGPARPGSTSTASGSTTTSWRPGHQ